MHKKLLIMIIIVILTTLTGCLQNQVQAAEITAEKVVTATDGSIDYIIKGLTLEDGASYQWAIEKSASASITNWYDVAAPEYATGTIRVSILSTNKEQLEILKSTDTAYITVRKTGTTTNLLNPYKVDLTLPLLKSYVLLKSTWYGGALGNPAYEVCGVYGIRDNISFKWEKITDANIVNNYIDNNHDLSGLKLKDRDSFPSLSDTSWKSVVNSYGDIEIKNREIPQEDGLYYLWLQGSATGVKTVYGQAVLEVGEVTKIKNNTGTNNTNNGGTTNQGTTNQGATNSGGSINQGTNNQGITNNAGNTNQGTTNKETTNKGTTNTNSSGTSSAKDVTVANTILPKTGKQITMIATIIILIAISLVMYKKCKKYKDVK